MYLYIQLTLSLIALAAVSSVTIAYIIPNQMTAKQMFAKWPYVVILFESAFLTPQSSPQVDLLLAITLSLIYWIGALATKSSLAEVSRLWKSLGFISPLLLVLLLNQAPDLASFYCQNIWVSTLISLLVLALIARIYISTRRLTSIIYALILLILTILLRFDISETLLLGFVGFTLLLELLDSLILLKEIRKEQERLSEQHKIFERQFEKEVAIEVKKRTFYMELNKEKMAEINRTDHLTKLLNRKTLITSVNDAISNKNISIFTLFVFDIDYFKQINDKHGHTTGDVCLKNLAGILRSQLTNDQIAGRFGGDEFIVVLPNKGFKEGLLFGRQLMNEISNQTNPSFSISMGMAVYPWDGETYKALFDIADKGLYFAKEKGRKRLGYKGYIKPNPQDLEDYEL